ncbi:MAG: aldose 1-epimerase family protein, partial [Oscillospiraceae bacterium]
SGDPAAWGRRAPVCVPWCGRMDGGYFETAGRQFQAGIHGFTRDLEHTLVEQGRDFLRFHLEVPADETRWPWAFTLDTEHRLEGNELITTMTLQNLSQGQMPTQMGYHTALRCPFEPGKVPTDYVFRFEQREAPDGTDLFPVTDDMFDDDSMCFEGLKSRWIQIEDKKTGQYLRVSTENYPYVLLWSQPKIPGFVCIEPWTGYPGPGHDLAQRPGTKLLAPGETMTIIQHITVA